MVIKLTRKKTIYITCAIMLGILIAVMPSILYPTYERRKVNFPRSIYPFESQTEQYNLPEEFQEILNLERRYALENNIIQALTTIALATILGFVFWLYSKKTT